MRVLVTGATWSAALAVIHALARTGYEVIGADTRRLCFTMRSRFIEKQAVLPINPEAFGRELVKLLGEAKPDVLLPIGQTRLIVRYQDRLKKYTRLLVPEEHSFETAFDNQKLIEECHALGIGAPRILREQEARAMLRDGARVVVKPRADVGGARGLHFIDNENILQRCLQAVEAQYSHAVIQEFIPGTKPMRTLTLLFDANSNLIAYFSMTKLRQWPPTGGISVLGVSTREGGLVDRVLPFFRRFRWKGPAEVEFKVDSRDNEPKVIEINPRFPGYIGFPIKCGLNLPQMICTLYSENKTTLPLYPEYAVGVKYLNPVGYLKSIFFVLRQDPRQIAIIHQSRRELRGPLMTNIVEWRDWPVVLAKLITRYKPRTDRSVWHVRH